MWFGGRHVVTILIVFVIKIYDLAVAPDFGANFASAVGIFASWCCVPQTLAKTTQLSLGKTRYSLYSKLQY